MPHRNARAKTARQRFDEKWTPEPNTGCWLWTAAIDAAGYGAVGIDGNRVGRAHRVGWELYRGPIPPGMMIDHICRVRSCVNPDHLRVVTPRQNATENSIGPAARHNAKTECSRGHPLSGHNLLIIHYKGRTGRRCRTCAYITGAAFRQRIRERKMAAGTYRKRRAQTLLDK